MHEAPSTLHPVGTEMEFAHLSLEERQIDGKIVTGWERVPDPVLRCITYECLPDHLSRTGMGITSQQFASDGARYYVDHAHYETARPLSGSLREAVTQFIVGQEVAYEAFAEARKRGYVRDFMLSLRLIDSTGNSWGYHENYMMSRSALQDDDRIIHWSKLWPLSLRLATSGLSGGAGCIFDGKFYLSQKALTLGKDICSSTTSDKPLTGKPLLNTRDAPHANRNKYYRAHVVSRDALINPLAHFRELGATSLMLAVIEENVPIRDMRVRGNQFELARLVAGDVTMQRVVQLQTGSTAHPDEIEEELINAVMRLEEYRDVSEEDQLALLMWQDVHARHRHARKEGVGKRSRAEAIAAVQEAACRILPDVVWAQRLAMLRGDHAKHPEAYNNAPFDSENVRHIRYEQLDQAFDRIDDPQSPKSSIGMRLRLNPQFAAFMPTRAEIDAAKYGLPHLAREAQRAEFIKQFPNSDTVTVDWEAIRSSHAGFLLHEPLERNQLLDDYLQKTRQAHAFLNEAS